MVEPPLAVVIWNGEYPDLVGILLNTKIEFARDDLKFSGVASSFFSMVLMSELRRSTQLLLVGLYALVFIRLLSNFLIMSMTGPENSKPLSETNVASEILNV